MRWAWTLMLCVLVVACDEDAQQNAAQQNAAQQSAAQTQPAAESAEGCPERMVPLPGGTCMDRHEARIVDGHAESAEGQLPADGLSFDDALAACEGAGYRLCTRDEWNAACGGEAHNDYPYGADYEQDRCNSAPDHSDLRSRALAPSGSFERCVSPLGVYDLSGNSLEWIDAADGTTTLRELRGGSFGAYPDRAKCEYEHNSFQPRDAAFSGQGFRCCSGG